MKKTKTYVIIPYMSVTDNGISVEFVNATFQERDVFSKRYPDPDFGAWLIEEIYNKKKLFANRKGFFKKRSFCPACDADISVQTRSPVQIKYELKYKDFTPFTMQITLPGIECPQCHNICGIDPDGSMSYHLNEAIIHMFKSVNIKP